MASQQSRVKGPTFGLLNSYLQGRTSCIQTQLQNNKPTAIQDSTVGSWSPFMAPQSTTEQLGSQAMAGDLLLFKQLIQQQRKSSRMSCSLGLPLDSHGSSLCEIMHHPHCPPCTKATLSCKSTRLNDYQHVGIGFSFGKDLRNENVTQSYNCWIKFTVSCMLISVSIWTREFSLPSVVQSRKWSSAARLSTLNHF